MLKRGARWWKNMFQLSCIRHFGHSWNELCDTGPTRTALCVASHYVLLPYNYITCERHFQTSSKVNEHGDPAAAPVTRSDWRQRAARAVWSLKLPSACTTPRRPRPLGSLGSCGGRQPETRMQHAEPRMTVEEVDSDSETLSTQRTFIIQGAGPAEHSIPCNVCNAVRGGRLEWKQLQAHVVWLLGLPRVTPVRHGYLIHFWKPWVTEWCSLLDQRVKSPRDLQSQIFLPQGR